MPDTPSATATPPAIADCLHGLLGELDPTGRCVILLFYADALTIEEIAAVVDQEPAEIRTQLNGFHEQAEQAIAQARQPRGLAA
ncbi:MAG: hypothetical protein AAF288_05685 [Planctomycetota bacterium]